MCVLFFEFNQKIIFLKEKNGRQPRFEPGWPRFQWLTTRPCLVCWSKCNQLCFCSTVRQGILWRTVGGMRHRILEFYGASPQACAIELQNSVVHPAIRAPQNSFAPTDVWALPRARLSTQKISPSLPRAQIGRAHV